MNTSITPSASNTVAPALTPIVGSGTMPDNFFQTISIKYGTSRAAETYGWNRVTLQAVGEPVKAVECGGGYDMFGSALATIMVKMFQHELNKWAEANPDKIETYYGLTVRDQGRVTLDGGCGYGCMERILKECLGVSYRYLYSYDRRGRVKDKIGMELSRNRSESAAQQ